MKKGLRVVATITLVCFLTTQSVWGAPTAGIEIANGRELPTYLSIDVPSELGTVDALYEAPGAAHPQFILHIQNAHANYDAQVKIKQLLAHMNKKYGFKTIFVEGASEKMDADYLRLFPDQKRNMELCDALAKKGELTGAELYLMEQGQGLGTRDLGLEKTRNRNESRGASDVSRAEDRQVEALGIENVSLYRSNYDALKKVFGAEADVNRFFSGFDSKLDRVASKTFTPEARQLIADWKRFEQGRREFMPFVRELAKRAKKTLDLDLESLFAQVGWPQISRLLAIQQLEKDLDKEKGLAEKEALIKALRKKHVSKELLATLTSFNEGSIAVGKSSAEVSPREILERLNSEAGPQGFKFSDYPAFSLFAGYVTLRSELDAKVLFEEIEYLFTQMLDAMAQDPQQKSLLSLYRDGELLRKLLHLELNRAQWRELLQNRDRMTVEALVTRLKDAVIASGDASVAKNKDVMSKDFNGKMSEIFDAGLSFYNYARQREDVFYQEMKSAMAERKITKAVLITGGFHTDGMSDMFRQNAVSYGIVTPRLSERSNEGLYRSMMMGKHSDAFDVSYLEATVKMQNPQIQFDQQGRYDATAIFAEFMKKINETDPAKVLAAYKAQTPAYQKLLASGLDVVISDGRITLIRAVFGPKAIVTAFQEAVEVSRGSSKHEDLARVTNDAFTAYSDAGAASETVEELRRHFENSSLGEEARSIFLAQLSRSESRGLTAVVKALALGAAISPFGLKAEMPATTEEPAAPAANTAPAIQPVIRGEKGVFTISDIRVTLPVAGVAAAAQGVTTSVTNAATPVFTSILQDAGDTVLGIVVAAEKAALSGFHFEIRGTADLKDWASILEFDYDGAMPKGATVAFGLRIPERLETKFRAVATGRSESREMVNLVVSMAAVGYLALGCATTNVPKGTAEISAPQAVSAKVDSHEAVRALDGKREMIMKDLANSETPVATLVNDLNLILGAQKATTKSNNARMRIAGFRKMVQEAWDGGRLQDPQVKPLAEEIMSITRSESRGHTGLKDPYWGSEHFVFTHRKDGPAPQPGPGDVFRVDLRGGSGTRTIAFKTDAGLEAFRGLEIDADTVKSDIDSLLENAEFNKSRIDRALKRSETLSILLMGWDPEVSSEILPVQDEALGQAIELLLKNSVGVNAERAFPKWRELALADLAARPDLNGTDIKAALTSAARQAELSATGEMVQDVLERVAAATEPVLRAENAVMDAEALRSYFVDDNKQFYAPAWDAFVGAFRARSESRTLLDAYASPEDFMDYLKNVALPHFFTAYPQALTAYQNYHAAFTAGNTAGAKVFAKEIDALVTQYNRAINHVGTYANRIQNFNYQTLVQADVTPVADTYSAEETLKGEDLVLEGAEVLEFFAAGAATRLGLGNMFLLSPRKFLQVFEMLPRVRAKNASGLDASAMKIYNRLSGREDKDLAALEAVAEVSIVSLRAMRENNPEFFDLPMGARVLLNRRASVEALVRKRYAGMEESLIQHQIERSLAKQQVSILLNEDVAQEAIAYLHSRNFFGFDRKNVYITVQPTFKGLAPANDVSKTIREVTDSELVNGHGHPSMQKFFAGQAFTVAENGEPQYLTVPLVDALYANGGKILSITRINDIIQYDFDSPQAQGNALDIPVLIAKVKEMGGFIALDDPEQGADEVFELLDNPAKAKGGIFPATPALKAQGFGIMPDTLAFDANRDKVTGVPADPDANGAVERIETAIGGGMPYNRMSQSYKLASLSAARKNGRLKGIPVYLRFREFDSGKPLAFAGETVTGDMAYFLNARAVRQPNRKINDFKEAKNTPTLLQVFAKEDALFKQLGYERYARSESRKMLTEVVLAVGVAGMLGLIGLMSTNYHMRIAERMARSREAMRGLSVSEGPVTLGRLAEKVRVPVAILKDQNYDSVLYYYYRDEMDAKKFLESFEGFLSPESAEDLNRLQAIVAIAETLRIQAVEHAQLIAQGKDLSKSDAMIVDLLLALENSATREYRNTAAREAFNQATTEAVGMLRAGASKQAALELALNAYDRYARSESRVTDEDQREAIKLVRSVVESLTQNNGMGGVEGRRQLANLGTLRVAQILMSTIVPQLDRTLQSLVDEIGDWPEISDADRSRAADSIKAMQATFAPRMEAYRSEITPEMLTARSESREVLFKVGDETFSVEIPKTLHARSHTFMVPKETPDLSFILKQGELSQMDASITAEYHIYIGNIDDEHIEDAKKQTPVESVPVKFVELYPQQSVGSDVIALGIEIAPDFVAALSKPDFLKDAAPGVKQLLAAWAHRLERQPVAVFANKVKTPKAKKSAIPVRSESRIELTEELKAKFVDALNQGIKDPALMVTLAMLDAKKLGKIVVPFKPEEDVAVYNRMLTDAQLAAANKAILDAINVTRAQEKKEPVKNPLILEQLPVANALWTIASLAGIASARSESRVTQEEKNDVITFIQTHMPALVVDYSGKPGDMKAAQTLGLMGSAFWTVLVPTDEKLGTGGIHSGASDERFSPFKTLFDEGFSGSETKGIRGALSLRQVIDRAQTSAELQAILVAAAAAQALASSAPGSAIRKAINAPELWSEPDLFTAMRDAILKTATWYAFESAKNSLPEQSEAIPTRKVWHFVTGIGTVADPGVVFDGVLFARNIGANDQDVTIAWDDLGTLRYDLITKVATIQEMKFKEPVTAQEAYAAFYARSESRKEKRVSAGAMVKDITLPNYFYHEIVLNNGEMVLFFDNVTLDGAPGKKRVVSLLGTAVRSNGESEGVTLKRKGMSETYTPATFESTVRGVPVEILLQSSKANTNQVVLRVKADANISVRVRKQKRSESRVELTAERIENLSPILGITPEVFNSVLGYSFDQIKAADKDERLGKTVSAKQIEDIEKVMGSKTGIMAGNTVASVIWILRPLTATMARSESREGVVAGAKWVSISPKVLGTPRAFGTNGIRGTGFNVDEIRRMTASTAIELKAEWERTHPGQPLPTLGVAVDPRPQGTEGFSMDFEKQMVYARAKAEVLAAYGFPVRFYAKPVGSGHMIATTSPSYPSEQQNFATLMGTASHNEVVDPKTGELQFGFKVFKGNAPIMDDFAAGISNHLNGNEALEIPQLQEVPVLDFDEAVKQGRIEIVEDPAAFEFERLNELYDFAALGRAFREKFPNKRIALNTMNGGASGLAPKILKAMGFTDENSRAFNTTFMNDPSMKKTVMEFVEGPGGKQVRFAPDPTRAWFRGKDYDAYMAQDLANTIAMLIDGDADRLVLEDLGEISPNQIGPMIKFYLNRYLKDQNPNYVDARTVPTTSAMDLLNKALGVATPKVTDVGSKNFVPFLGDLQVGLEESGHIAFRYKGQVFFDHPVALMLLMMKMMADTGKTWRELEDEMWAFIQEKTGAPRIETSRTGIGKDEGAEAYYPLLAKLPKDAALRQSFGEAIAAEFKAQGLNVSLEGFDTNAPGGVQFHLSSFVRTMPRKSGTDGSVRFYFESPSDQVATLKKIGTPVMKKVLDQFLARSESRKLMRRLASIFVAGALGLPAAGAEAVIQAKVLGVDVDETNAYVEVGLSNTGTVDKAVSVALMGATSLTNGFSFLAKIFDGVIPAQTTPPSGYTVVPGFGAQGYFTLAELFDASTNLSVYGGASLALTNGVPTVTYPAPDSIAGSATLAWTPVKPIVAVGKGILRVECDAEVYAPSNPYNSVQIVLYLMDPYGHMAPWTITELPVTPGSNAFELDVINQKIAMVELKAYRPTYQEGQQVAGLTGTGVKSLTIKNATLRIPAPRSESRIEDLREIAKTAIQKAYQAVMAQDLATKGMTPIYKQRKQVEFALTMTNAVQSLSVYDAPESLSGILDAFKKKIAILQPATGWTSSGDIIAYRRAIGALDAGVMQLRSESRTPTERLKPISKPVVQPETQQMMSWRQSVRQQELANQQRPIRVLNKFMVGLSVFFFAAAAIAYPFVSIALVMPIVRTAIFSSVLTLAIGFVSLLSTFAEYVVRSVAANKEKYPRQNMKRTAPSLAEGIRPLGELPVVQPVPAEQMTYAQIRDRLEMILAESSMAQRMKNPARQEELRQEMGKLLGQLNQTQGRSESRELGAKALQQLQAMDVRIRQLIAEDASMDEIVALEEKRAAMLSQFLGITTPKKTAVAPVIAAPVDEARIQMDGLAGEIDLVTADMTALREAYQRQLDLLREMKQDNPDRAKVQQQIEHLGAQIRNDQESLRKLTETLEAQKRSESRDDLETAEEKPWVAFGSNRFGRKAPNGEFYLGLSKEATHPGQAIVDMIDAILRQKEGEALVKKGFTVDDDSPELAEDLFDVAAMFIDVPAQVGVAEPVVAQREDGRFYVAAGQQNPFTMYLNALRKKIDLQLRLDKALEVSENKVLERQQFAAELVKDLTPVEIAMLQEGRTGFSPASILQVFSGIVVAVDIHHPDAHEAALLALRAYLVELRSGEFSFERYIENVGRLVANHKVFHVSEASGILIRDVQIMPSSAWFWNLALQLATNVTQRVQVVVNKAMISEENCSAIDAQLSLIRKMAGADGKGIRERLAVSFETDVAEGMAQQAQHLGKVSEGLYPVLYTEDENVRRALVDKADSLFGTVVFGENKTAADDALAPMRDVAALKLSQQKRSGQINTQDDLNTILAELLKEMPNVFKFAGKDQITLENSALAGLAHVLQQLISAAATAKSA